MLNYTIMKIHQDEISQKPSFSDLGKEAVALIHETLMSGGTSFVKSTAIVEWESELILQLKALDEKLGEEEAHLLRSVIDHRLQKISPVSGAFHFGTDEVLVEDDVVGKDRVKQVQESLITAETRITCVTKLVESFLNENDIYLINSSEIVETYAKAMGLNVTLLGIIPELESAVSKSHWSAALEEILWNAKKYGASSITVWITDTGCLCVGNNGRVLTSEQAELVATGEQPYKDVKDSRGDGTKLIRQPGFTDYELRPSTEAENRELNVGVVAQFGILAVFVGQSSKLFRAKSK